jgi:vacuolar protein sorting-associated protein 13A/C
MKKGVFGITDSMSRFTGSLGKGISAATMDKKFQDRRKMDMIRNKPTHAIYGVTQGVGYFGSSVASGFAGLVVNQLSIVYVYIRCANQSIY